jgi:hypothetical protein
VADAGEPPATRELVVLDLTNRAAPRLPGRTALLASSLMSMDAAAVPVRPGDLA